MRLVARLGPLLFRVDPVPVDETLQNGERLNVLGGATVVRIPGHSPGSIPLYFPSERLLICGDAIDCCRNRPGPPPEGFSFDMGQATDSLRRMADLEFDVLCPGHGAPIIGGAGGRVRAMVPELDG